jgi:hypothetical protein
MINITLTPLIIQETAPDMGTLKRLKLHENAYREHPLYGVLLDNTEFIPL